MAYEYNVEKFGTTFRKTNTMKQKPLISKLVVINCLLLILIAGVYYSQQEKQDYVLAQDNLVEDTPTGLTCDFPIPVASPLKGAVELIDNVYQEYQDNVGYLESAIATMQGIIGVIGDPETEETVCDFTVCRTNPTNAMYGEVANVSFDLRLRANLLVRTVDALGLRPGICIPGDCVGGRSRQLIDGPQDRASALQQKCRSDRTAHHGRRQGRGVIAPVHVTQQSWHRWPRIRRCIEPSLS